MLAVIGLFVLLALPLISGKIYKQFSTIDVRVSCTYNGTFCASPTICNITIDYPNSSLMIDNENMTVTGNGRPFYRLPDTTITGTYEYSSTCCRGTECDDHSSNFKITSTGVIQTSILENPIIIILIALGLALLILGVYLTVPALAFFAALMFLLGGIYTMIYGFNNVTDLYTRGIAITLIGIGIIFMFLTVYEWMFAEEE